MEKKIFFLCIIGYFFLFTIFGSSNFVHAKQTISNADSVLSQVAGRTGISTGDVSNVSGQIIKTALGLTTLVFFILVVYAGFRWMLARGDQDGVTAARGTLVMVSIGFVVVAGSYAITNFVTSRLVERQSNTNTLAEPDGGTLAEELGCCFDQVRHPGSGPEVRATTWQWRITTQADCKAQGEKPASFDEIYGDGTWQFAPVDTKAQCEALFKTFCNATDCYDLGF